MNNSHYFRIKNDDDAYIKGITEMQDMLWKTWQNY